MLKSDIARYEGENKAHKHQQHGEEEWGQCGRRENTSELRKCSQRSRRKGGEGNPELLWVIRKVRKPVRANQRREGKH